MSSYSGRAWRYSHKAMRVSGRPRALVLSASSGGPRAYRRRKRVRKKPKLKAKTGEMIVDRCIPCRAARVCGLCLWRCALWRVGRAPAVC